MKDASTALATYEWGWKKHGNSPQGVRLLAAQAGLLTAEGRAGEAQKLLEEHWQKAVQAGPILANDFFGAYAAALKAQNKNAELLAALPRILSEVPAYLSGQRGQGAWIYEQMVNTLLEEKKHEQALGWGRLHFMLCNFNKASLERANRLLGRIWAAQDNFAALRAFSQAQSDRSKPNPLSKVALPRLEAAPLEARLAALGRLSRTGPRSEVRAHERISILIVLRRSKEAMNEARQMLLERPDLPHGASEVSRIFKAQDLSAARANAFLEFLAGGTSVNPLTEFLGEKKEKEKEDSKAEEKSEGSSPNQKAPGDKAPGDKMPASPATRKGK